MLNNSNVRISRSHTMIPIAVSHTTLSSQLCLAHPGDSFLEKLKDTLSSVLTNSLKLPNCSLC